MKHILDIQIPKPIQTIKYNDKIMLIGSCFTEHIASRLSQYLFDTCSNPNGILFNPLSVANSLVSYDNNTCYKEEQLFYLNELWNSWDHHSRFSDIEPQQALININTELSVAHNFLKDANWLIITLGSSFQYFLTENDYPVANNHRAPANWFYKKLLSIHEIYHALLGSINTLRLSNPNLQIIFTVSPVRHIRDGVIANNRSKARLLECVHKLCEQYDFINYFPAYEIVVDVLRDYRYYDIDLVHPNYAATSHVWEYFIQTYFDSSTQNLLSHIQDLVVAKNHRPRFDMTQSHKDFCAKYLQKAMLLQSEHPYIDLKPIISYFKQYV